MKSDVFLKPYFDQGKNRTVITILKPDIVFPHYSDENYVVMESYQTKFPGGNAIDCMRIHDGALSYERGGSWVNSFFPGGQYKKLIKLQNKDTSLKKQLGR